jgi:DNA polymerase-3 subunit gamma/tau
MPDPATPYRVLARKYRPQTFAEVIGQEAMVRTLSNAIQTGRIAHAFILTGVRGVGKTTTARIIARALNCIGPDGGGGPTITPCGVCANCRSIAEDRHVDVIEMDAASRTGVDDIRDLTEGVRYRPVSARYKIYIIDEVHMLSKNAFNALLKTLEEPPPEIIFIFATTEVHRVPVTILSRCQRFSLRRVPIALLTEHYRKIAAAEGIAVAPAALGLIARAADGSVRDGLSLLDQAIALSAPPKEAPDEAGEAELRRAGATIAEALVRDMLGIADRGLVFELFEAVMRGDAAGALDRLDSLYQGGADPLMALQDLLELTHFITRLKLAPEAGAGDPLEEGERERGRPLAARLTMPVLARAWQMLLKGLEEMQAAPLPAQAAAMILVRLAYVAELPAPADLVRALSGAAAGAAAPTTSSPPSGESAGVRRQVAVPSADPAPSQPVGPGPSLSRNAGAGLDRGSGPASALAALPQPAPSTAPSAELAVMPQSFLEVVALFDQKREALLRSHLWSQVHLVAFEPGHIELRPEDGAPRDLANRLGQLLGEWTGIRWIVAVSQAEGMPTLATQEARRASALRNEIAAHPLVQAALEAFPGATIAAVRERFAVAEAGSEAAPGELGDELGDGATSTGDEEP